MSDQQGITDEALRPILAPGERTLYRVRGQLMPAQLWKRFTASYFDVACSLVVTTRRFLALRRKVGWFQNEFTAEPLLSLDLAQIAYMSSFGAIGRYTLTVQRTDGVCHHFQFRGGGEALRTFVHEMPARFNTRRLPRE